jgi:hypothetical protein
VVRLILGLYRQTGPGIEDLDLRDALLTADSAADWSVRQTESGFGVCDRLRGHILATIWPQLQLTTVNYCDVFTQLEAVRCLTR